MTTNGPGPPGAPGSPDGGDGPPPQTLDGVVQRVVFRGRDNDFAIVRLDVRGRSQPVTVVGPLAEVGPGEPLRLEGAWERHPVHGEQFRARAVALEVPRTPEGVRRYLEGLAGLGPTTAARLVQSFGVDALEVLEKEPWRAGQVKGVGKRKAAALAAEVQARAREREVMIFLQGLGVSAAYARRIRRVYGDEAIAKVRANPYRLARDVPGIGFYTADRIARGMGIERTSPLRLQAGVLHTLQTVADEGHVYLPRELLAARAAEALEADGAECDAATATLVHEGALMLEGDEVYLPWLYRAEAEAARRVKALLTAEGRPPAALARGELPSPPPGTPPLAEGQRHAVALTARARVVVVTGGPGTGKTTVVRTIVRAWEAGGRRVLLAAPTGRAAKRLSEATGRAAVTIHRLLEWGRGQPGATTPFARNQMNPLETDLLVVDEASMLDIALFRAVVDAVPLGATLVLVGDVDQLPSVGPGQVLADVLSSGVVPTVRLTEIFRQAEGSGITENAYRILAGEMPVGAPRDRRDADFYTVSAEEPERARDLVVKLVKERIPTAFGLDPRRDVQVLSPMHRGAAGTEELNRLLQAELNPRAPGVDEITEAGRTFRVGDKVMQVRNDYDRDVYNGDIGRVTRAVSDESGTLVEVDWGGRRAEYGADDLGQLELAYAVSVHKSQGSEYPAVVVPLVMAHFVLLKRNLLYTAVTRGKRLVVLVGSERAVRRAVREADAQARYTALRRRLATDVVR